MLLSAKYFFQIVYSLEDKNIISFFLYIIIFILQPQYMYLNDLKTYLPLSLYTKNIKLSLYTFSRNIRSGKKMIRFKYRCILLQNPKNLYRHSHLSWFQLFLPPVQKSDDKVWR